MNLLNQILLNIKIMVLSNSSQINIGYNNKKQQWHFSRL